MVEWLGCNVCSYIPISLAIAVLFAMGGPEIEAKYFSVNMFANVAGSATLFGTVFANGASQVGTVGDNARPSFGAVVVVE